MRKPLTVHVSAAQTTDLALLRCCCCASLPAPPSAQKIPLPQHDRFLVRIPRDEAQDDIGFGIRGPTLVERGSRIEAVAPGSSADKAGVQAGDILMKVNGHIVVDTDHRAIITELCTSSPPSQPIEHVHTRLRTSSVPVQPKCNPRH
jgi:S1-C subfamily serine protease